MRDPLVVVGAGHGGVAPDGVVEVQDRLPRPPLGGVEAAPVVVGHGVVGVQTDGCVAVLERPGGVTQLGAGLRPVGVREAVVRVETEHGVVVVDGEAVIAQLGARDGPVVAGVGIRRIDDDGGGEVVHRAAVVAEVPVAEAADDQRPSIAGVGGERGVEALERLAQLRGREVVEVRRLAPLVVVVDVLQGVPPSLVDRLASPPVAGDGGRDATIVAHAFVASSRELTPLWEPVEARSRGRPGQQERPHIWTGAGDTAMTGDAPVPVAPMRLAPPPAPARAPTRRGTAWEVRRAVGASAGRPAPRP